MLCYKQTGERDMVWSFQEAGMVEVKLEDK